MKLGLILVLVVGLVTAGYLFRYEYETQTIQGISFTVRINRLTGNQCLYSGPGSEILSGTLSSFVETLYGMPKCTNTKPKDGPRK